MSADPAIPGGYTWVRDESGEEWNCACGGTMMALKVQPDRSRAYVRSIHLCDNPSCKVQPAGSSTQDGRALLLF